MRQMIFDSSKEKIVEELPNYWKTKEDIPHSILNFIESVVQQLFIYTKKEASFYCSTCLEKLDSNFCCPKCKRKYEHCKDYSLEDFFNAKFAIEMEDLKDIDNCFMPLHFYAFDVDIGEVLFYHIEVVIYYDNPCTFRFQKTYSIKIKESYHITEEGLTHLEKKKFTSFKELNEQVCGDFNHDIIMKYLFLTGKDHIYLENLEMLKDTIYRYSLLWEASDYLKTHDVAVFHFLFTAFCKSFEYLMKKKAYSLAFDDCFSLEYHENMKQFFDEKKPYLSFILKNQLNRTQFEALCLCQKMDMDLLQFLEKNIQSAKELYQLTKIDFQLLKQYFDKQNRPAEFLTEYVDYLIMAQELGYHLNDKTILYPKNIEEAHEQFYLQTAILKDDKINEKIKELSEVLRFNIYEDEDYIIFPASSLESLIEESRQQQNCVRTYCRKYSENKSQIYFMRNKKNKDISFVTIEVCQGKVIQARTKYNELPSEKIMKILKEWEKNILPVEYEIENLA